MEPLAALSLAGNVIQFIEFSCKLCSQGCELYKSTDGRLAVDDEIRLITIEMKELIQKIQSTTVTELPESAEASSVDEEADPDLLNFELICDEAAKIAEAILTKLEHRTLDRGRNRKLESFKCVWSQIWSQGELDALFDRLSRLRDAINSGVLAAILHNTNEIKKQALAYTHKCDQEAQSIVKSALESAQSNTDEVLEAVAQLASRMEMFIRDEEIQTRVQIMNDNEVKLDMLSLDSRNPDDEAFSLSRWGETKLRSLVNYSILSHLNYDMLRKRYEAVVEAHPKTFEWVFQDLKGTTLSTWLKRGSGLYWICGKPGSGKSTLMKHILDDPRTKTSLETWARRDGTPDTPLIIATFFFWNSGTLQQRSQMGMLRSLLFQVCEQKPELLPIILPSVWLTQYGKYLANGPHVVWSQTWNTSMLMEAFKRLAIQQDVSCKLFFLIDGLDEFDGDHELLAELFNHISAKPAPGCKSAVKLCVSSRPYVVFQDNFEGCPMLKLQDLTVHDITLFVRDRFLGNGAFRKLAGREPETSTQLIDAVVSKSDGVFLWVFIVVKDLLKGIRGRDTITDLWRRLDALPRELEPLYIRIMSEIDPIYHIWSSKAFQILRAVRQMTFPSVFDTKVGTDQRFVSLADLHFALDEDIDTLDVKHMEQLELERLCRETEFHITARCGCLLEVTQAKKISEGEVRYLHRTAKDFLEDPERWKALVNNTKDVVFDPWLSMLRSKSRLIHRILARGDYNMLRVMNIFVMMLLLAMQVDRYGPFFMVRLTLLADAEDLTSNFNTELIRRARLRAWYTISPNDSIPESLRGYFLVHALSIDFWEYVDLKLTESKVENPRAVKLAATFMLRYLESARKVRMKMVTVLVQHGADMNVAAQAPSVWTLWQSILADGIGDGLLDHEKTVDPALPHLMITALAFGADPGVSIGTPPVTLVDYVESYIHPNYPAAARQLQCEIKTAKARWRLWWKNQTFASSSRLPSL